MLKPKKIYSPFVLFVITICLFSYFPNQALADFFVIPVGGPSLKASDAVELGTTHIPADSSNSKDVLEITPRGANGGTYTVPDGKVLVINSLQIFPQSLGTGTIRLYLIQNSVSRKFWVVPQSGPTFMNFSPGLIVDSGYRLEIRNSTSSAAGIRVSMYGYEAPNF